MDISNNPIRFIQLSDTHLFADLSRELLGVPTEESFQTVLQTLSEAKQSFDFILVSGDLSQDGSKESYKRIASALEPFQVPVYIVPGNHDNPKVIAEIFPQKTISNLRHVVLNKWQIILLNSQKAGKVEGYLDESQLKHLQQCLQAYPEHRALVVLHHPPLQVGATWLDNVGLKETEKFWQLLADYKNVHSVLFGHAHQEFVGSKQGIPCYGLPSTCIQFTPNTNYFSLDNIPPGYRWINIYEDGRLETGIVRASRYIGNYDEKAKGY